MWPCWTISLSLASLTLDMWWFWREMSMKIYMRRLVASWWTLGKWLVMRAVTPIWMNSMMGSQTGDDRKLKVGPKCREWAFGDCILSLASSSSSSHFSSLWWIALSWWTLIILFCLTIGPEQKSQGTMDWNSRDHEPNQSFSLCFPLILCYINSQVKKLLISTKSTQ